MILWPGALPQQLLVEGYEEQLSNMLIRTEMDAGPAKVRRRFTAAPRPVNGQIVVTPAQLVFFRAWYYNVLLGGSLRFGWTDPFTTDEITNLLSNGGFEEGTEGWLNYQCTSASIPGGVYGKCCELTRVTGATQYIPQNLTLSPGKTYCVSGYAKSGTSGNEAGDFTAWDKDGGVLEVAFLSSESWTFHRGMFVCANTETTVFAQKHSDTPGTMLFDEVSLVDITSGVVEMRFIEPPTLSPIDPTAIRINMALEILP